MSSYWIDSYKNMMKNKAENSVQNTESQNDSQNINQVYSQNGQIDGNYKADVCIIGAGMCGLTTAYYLSKKGLKVIIVDKGNIGEKVSGNTTAKITFQHNLIYDYLINNFGIETALAYLESNKKAISNIKKIIDDENIDCDFEYTDNFVYTTFQDELVSIHNEINALNLLAGYLKNSCAPHSEKSGEDFAQFVTNCELPFKIAGACKVKNQAQFNPVKYMYGLAKAIKENDGLIFTNSLVTDVRLELDSYRTFVNSAIGSNNYTISSKYVVLASHFPFINFPGLHFLKMYQSTSYAIAVDTDKKLFNGMYINPKEPIFSFRTTPYDVFSENLANSTSMHLQDTDYSMPKTSRGKRLLIMAGGDHKTGYAPDNSKNGYEILEHRAKELYPDCKILYKWNTHDCITLDKIPYIGDFSNLMPNMYIATGFKKWGMTFSNVAAHIIKDKILGKENKYEFVYKSTRVQPFKNKGEMTNIVSQVFKSFVSNRIKIPEDDLFAIKKGNGGIIRINGSAVGIYKDLDGNVFAVNPTCTHLGCLLTWNNLDKTWDCPCHGSRFDYTGKNIYDPAFKDLETYNVEN